MPISCSAFRCKNRAVKASERTGDNLRLFHRFPVKKGALLEKWLLAVGRENWIPSRHSFLCSDHFVESDYRHGFGAHKRLKLDAVPSKFNFISSNAGKLSKIQREFVNEALSLEKSIRISKKSRLRSFRPTSIIKRITQKELEAVGEITREEFFAFVNGTTPKQNIEDCTITSCEVLPDGIPTSECEITVKQEIDDSTITSSEVTEELNEECFSFINGSTPKKDTMECTITGCEVIPDDNPISECGITVKQEVDDFTMTSSEVTEEDLNEKCFSFINGSTPKKDTQQCAITSCELIPDYEITVKKEIEDCTSCKEMPEEAFPMEQCTQTESTTRCCQATAAKSSTSQYGITVKKEIKDFTSCEGIPEDVFPIETCTQTDSSSRTCKASAEELPTSENEIIEKQEIEDSTITTIEQCTQTEHVITRKQVRHRLIQTDEAEIEPPREKQLLQKIDALKKQRYRLSKKVEALETIVKVLKRK